MKEFNSECKYKDYHLHVAMPEDENQRDALRKATVRLQDLGSNSKILRELGEHLWRAAFSSNTGIEALADALQEAVASGRKLRLWIEADSLAVAALPWEYLCFSDAAIDELRKRQLSIVDEDRPRDRFLALNSRICFVRQGPARLLDEPVRRIGALRVLIAWANPANGDWEDIPGIDNQAEAIHAALKRLPRSHCEVRILPHSTPSRLRTGIRDFRPQVLHFIGHGAYPDIGDPDGRVEAPSLVLESDAVSPGGHEYFAGAALAELCAANDIRMAVLNCCWGAAEHITTVGVARSLVTPTGNTPPVPIVIAMQFPVSQAIARRFAMILYQDLSTLQPPEEAVYDFRDVFVDHFDSGFVDKHDWGIPVVYLGTEQTALFRNDRVDPYPLSFQELIASHVRRVFLTGRQFVRKRIERFIATHESGVFLLYGPPGIGKTAFMADWVEHNPDHSETVHFFFRATAGITNPDECLLSLYHGLCGKYGRVEEKSVPSREAQAWLQSRLRDISQNELRGGQKEILVVDALDEAFVGDRESMLRRLSLDLPTGVYLLLSSRHSDDVEAFEGPNREKFELRQDAEENMADARQYVEDSLRRRLGTSYDEAELRSLCDRICQSAAGNFLLLSLLCRDVGSIDMAGVETMLSRVSDLRMYFEECWSRMTERLKGGPKDFNLLTNVLGLLAIAHEPLAYDLVNRALNVGSGAWEWAFRHISQFLDRVVMRGTERGEEAYRLFHETFREFVIEKLAGDLPRLRGLLAEVCWREYQAGVSAMSPYASAYLPTHLAEVGRWAELFTVVADHELDYMTKWVEEGQGDTGLPCLIGLTKYLEEQRLHSVILAGFATQVARIYSVRGEHDEAQRWLELALTHTSSLRGRRVRAVAIHELGSLYLYRGELQQAIRCYEQALRLCLEADEVHHDEAAANLVALASISYRRAQFAETVGLASDALARAKLAKDIRHEIAAEQWIGSACQRLGRFEEADARLRTALELCETRGLEVQKARVLTARGWLYLRQARLREELLKDAIISFRNALDTARRAHDLYCLLDAEFGLGNCALASGSTIEAADWFQQIRNTLPPGIHQEMVAHLAVGLAGVIQQKGDLEEAGKQYQEAVTLSEKFGQHGAVVRGLIGLGAVHWHLGKYTQAKTAWNQAIRLAGLISSHDLESAQARINRCKVDATVTPW